MTTAIHVELELTECSGELWLNGFPLPSLPQKRPMFEVSVPMHQALVTGMNDLEMWVDVRGGPNDNKQPRRVPPNPAAKAIARVVEYPVGAQADPTEGKVLATMTYEGAKDDGDEAPRLRRLGFDLGQSFGPWAWQKAPELVLDEMTMKEAAGVVREVHAALFGGDPDKLFQLIELSWKELDRAYPGRDDAADVTNHATWVRDLAKDPRRMIPLEPSRHAFRLIAGGRLIECIDEDFFPSIRIAQEVEPDRWAAAPYAIALGRNKDGKLVVMR
jgi:hypothetical protein